MTITAPNQETTNVEIHAPVTQQERKSKNIHFFDAQEALQKTLVASSKDKTPLKNQGDRDKIIKIRGQADTNISDIKVHKKLKYIEFMYKERYKIQYDPEGNNFLDKISVTDSINQTHQEIKIKKSLFLDNLMPKNKKEYKTQLQERLAYITKAYNDIYSYITKNDLIMDGSEYIYIIGDKIYFTAENKSEEAYYFTLTYTKEGKENDIKKTNEENSNGRFDIIESM